MTVYIVEKMWSGLWTTCGVYQDRLMAEQEALKIEKTDRFASMVKITDHHVI